MDDSLVVRIEQGGQERIVRLSGEIDMASVKRMPQCLLEPDAAVLTIDLSGVTFMDSAGFNMLVRVQKCARDRGGKLIVYGIQPKQMHVLGVLGLDDYFDSIVPD